MNNKFVQVGFYCNSKVIILYIEFSVRLRSQESEILLATFVKHDHVY